MRLTGENYWKFSELLALSEFYLWPITHQSTEVSKNRFCEHRIGFDCNDFDYSHRCFLRVAMQLGLEETDPKIVTHPFTLYETCESIESILSQPVSCQTRSKRRIINTVIIVSLTLLLPTKTANQTTRWSTFIWIRKNYRANTPPKANKAAQRNNATVRSLKREAIT